MKFTLAQNLKYALAVAGVRFGWWLMGFGRRTHERGIAFTSWVEETATEAGLESLELVWRAEEATYGPLPVSGQ